MPSFSIERVATANNPKLLDMMFSNDGNGTYKYHAQIGWSTVYGATEIDPSLSEALTVDYVQANDGQEIELYPVFDEGNASHKYNWLVKRADGSVRFAHTTYALYGSDWTERGGGKGTGGDGTEAVKLEYGETFVVLSDKLLFASNFTSLRATKDTAEELVFNFDLNGKNIVVDPRENNNNEKLGAVFSPAENETINFYSSVPGASIDCYGYANKSAENYAVVGGVLFVSRNNNAIINVGTVTVNGTTYSGSNLTVMGDQVAQVSGPEIKNEQNVVIGHAETTGGAINFNNCTIVRTTRDYESMFNSRVTKSAINVNNCLVIIAAGGHLVSNHATGNDYAATIRFNNSTIIAKNNQEWLIGNQNNIVCSTFNNTCCRN